MAGTATAEPLAPAEREPVTLSDLRFALLLMAALSVTMAYGVTLPRLPSLVGRLESGAVAAEVARHTGWPTGAYTLALFIFSPAWEALSERVDRRVVIAVGLMGSSLALWALDRAGTLRGLYIARIAAGAERPCDANHALPNPRAVRDAQHQGRTLPAGGRRTSRAMSAGESGGFFATGSTQRKGCVPRRPQSCIQVRC
jgi:hypothetical protein